MITEEDEPRRRLTGEHDVDASRAENAENQDKPGRKNLAEPDEKQENRTSKELEFGGAGVVIFNMIMMTVSVFLVNAACNKEKCTILQWPGLPSCWRAYFTFESVIIYASWILLQVGCAMWIPGRYFQGCELRGGGRLSYKCNGWLTLEVTVGGFLLAWHLGFPVTILYRNFNSLITMSTLVSWMSSILLYVKSHWADSDQLGIFGNTGGTPGCGLFLVVMGHALYVVDALYFEPAALTTFDLIAEGFGFMLTFGDLTWVPFIFSLQARFLLEHPQSPTTFYLICCALLNGLGYWIFRCANSEKDAHKHRLNANCDSGEAVLLADGWWAWSRHPNYLGDMIMSVAWCLPCGFNHVLPWYYCIYLFGALVHRCERDDKRCHGKYGHLWKKHCQQVPYKIIPHIY